jgi:predicted kinase
MKELYILCGLPASGKSYWARENLGGFVEISNDAIVQEHAESKEISYNEAYAEMQYKYIAAECRRRFVSAVEKGESIYVDNTHMTAKSRARYKAEGYERYCVLFQVSEAELKRRTAKRNEEGGKIIPKEAIDNMKRIYEKPKKEEGFSKITIVKG